MKWSAAFALAGLVLAPVTGRAEEPLAGTAAASADLDRLLAQWSAMPGLQAAFSEDKQLALLVAPLHSEGSIHFLRGRGVAVHTRAPSRQSVLVTERELTLWDGRSVRRIRLDASPAVAAFAQVFSLLLGADRASLDRTFVSTFRGRPDGAWSLHLEPRAQSLRDAVGAIDLEGNATALSVLRVREGNGDVSTMRFTAVDAAHRYTDDEANRVFRAPPP